MYLKNGHLSGSISSLLRSATLDDSAIIEGLECLATTHGIDTYDEFFYVLTQTRFGAEQAFSHWNNVISHVDSFINVQYAHQGLLPSILHYLQKKTGVICDPRFFESNLIENIQQTSITDGLTGLYNQTYFKNTLANQIRLMRRHGGSQFSVVLFDLDHFKQYNDTLGHLAGDHALKKAASIIQKNLRESDIAARYGGEEFAVFLPHTSSPRALKVANRIRLAIENATFKGQELTPAGRLTISGGVAEYSKEMKNAEALIEAADRELYIAKARRNCICPNVNDRRRDIRRPVRSLVEYAPHGESLFRTALSVDISEVGLALGCEWRFEVDEPVNIKFRKPYWTNDITLDATVRQMKKVGDLNCYGMEFMGGFPEDITTFMSYVDTNSQSTR